MSLLLTLVITLNSDIDIAIVNRLLNRCLWVYLEREPVGCRVDHLLCDVEVRQGADLTQERHVVLSQLEHCVGPQGAGQEAVADQGPRLDRLVLTVVLGEG